MLQVNQIICILEVIRKIILKKLKFQKLKFH